MTDAGTIDVSSNVFVRQVENPLFVNNEFDASKSWSDNLRADDGTQTGGVAILKLLEATYPSVGTTIPLYYYAIRNDASVYNGSVVNVGTPPGYAFKAGNLAESYAILAHELGHVPGLVHPNTPAAPTQMPNAHIASIGQPIMPEPATNTEPAIRPDQSFKPGDREKVMALDPLNMMGYWPAFQEQVYIRYMQWKVCRTIARIYEVE